jgi:aspartyl/glutamyl-tRNA(Asn/Gln) amidotransferase C subunit
MSQIITKKDVIKIAELAKLKLTEKEISQYEKELSEFFEHAKALEEVDTE